MVEIGGSSMAGMSGFVWLGCDMVVLDWLGMAVKGGNMGLFHDDYKTKFWKLIKAIDERYVLYEKIVNEGTPPHPPGLETLLQEFKNLKVKSWSIETNDNNTLKLIKDLKKEDIQAQIEKDGDVK